jgi:hypothetical protein
MAKDYSKFVSGHGNPLSGIPSAKAEEETFPDARSNAYWWM